MSSPFPPPHPNQRRHEHPPFSDDWWWTDEAAFVAKQIDDYWLNRVKTPEQELDEAIEKMEEAIYDIGRSPDHHVRFVLQRQMDEWPEFWDTVGPVLDAWKEVRLNR